jgi:hypothetical protein
MPIMSIDLAKKIWGDKIFEELLSRDFLLPGLYMVTGTLDRRAHRDCVFYFDKHDYPRKPEGLDDGR